MEELEKGKTVSGCCGGGGPRWGVGGTRAVGCCEGDTQPYSLLGQATQSTAARGYSWWWKKATLPWWLLKGGWLAAASRPAIGGKGV